MSDRLMLVGGKLVPGDVELEASNPSDGTSLGTFPEASAAQVAEAVESSARAFEHWRTTSIPERQEMLRRLVAGVADHADELAELEALCAGMPLKQGLRDVERAIDEVEYFIGLAWEAKGVTVPGRFGRLAGTLREPYGPTARIVAFNHPLSFSLRKLAAPLLTGNTVILKVPEQAPLAPLLLARILSEVAPPGVVNVVSGRGSTTGDALVSHPGVRRVGFIGSVPTGRLILQRCAERIVPTTLELGGKNPFVVCPDADLDKAADTAVAGMNLGIAGQSCGSLSRVVVHRSRLDDLAERIASRLDALVVGDARDSQTNVGPMINRASRDRVAGKVDEARGRGGEVVAGGRVPDDGLPAGGHYYRPTLVRGLTPGDPLCQEELFGPVQVMLPWDDVEEAIEIANGIEFGLVGCVHTNDLGAALEIASRLEAGSVAVNGGGETHWRGLPFGGFKASGLGKEEDLNELLESTWQKSVAVVPN